MEAGESRGLRVVIADDHPISRSGLVALIEDAGDMLVVGEASNGLEAVDAYRKHRPDVMLMDLGMPGMGGLEAIAVLRSDFPDARFVVLSALQGEEDVFRAVEAGALAYLLKNTPTQDLLDAIRAVHAGRCYLPPAVGERLAERLASPAQLTPREVNVLGHMVRGASNRDVAARLRTTEGAIAACVHGILVKLGTDDRTRAVVVALRRGILHLE